MSIVLIFFLAKIHNRIKSDNGALNQPIVKRLPRGGRHKYNSHATGLQRLAPPWLCSFLVGRLLGFVKLVRKYGRYISKVRKLFSTWIIFNKYDCKLWKGRFLFWLGKKLTGQTAYDVDWLCNISFFRWFLPLSGTQHLIFFNSTDSHDDTWAQRLVSSWCQIHTSNYDWCKQIIRDGNNLFWQGKNQTWLTAMVVTYIRKYSRYISKVRKLFSTWINFNK